MVERCVGQIFLERSFITTPISEEALKSVFLLIQQHPDSSLRQIKHRLRADYSRRVSRGFINRILKQGIESGLVEENVRNTADGDIATYKWVDPDLYT